MDLYLKSDGGYVKKELSNEDYLGWFKSNTNDEGDVTEDCLLYKDADLKINTDKSVTFIMSDDSLDRDFERFDTAGWNLKTYKKNPVLLWSHDRSIPAIGLMEKTRVKDNQLIGNPVFDMDDPLAVQIAGKVQKKVLRSGSVGFFPSKVEFNDDDKDPCRLTYMKQELREFSVCNVPANPNAVVVEEGKAKEGTAEQLKDTNAWTKRVPGNYQPTDNDIVNIGTAVISIVEWEEYKMKVDAMEEGLEKVQNMLMHMKQTVAKDDKNYYTELLKTKKPQPQGLKELLQQRRTV